MSIFFFSISFFFFSLLVRMINKSLLSFVDDNNWAIKPRRTKYRKYERWIGSNINTPNKAIKRALISRHCDYAWKKRRVLAARCSQNISVNDPKFNKCTYKMLFTLDPFYHTFEVCYLHSSSDCNLRTISERGYHLNRNPGKVVDLITILQDPVLRIMYYADNQQPRTTSHPWKTALANMKHAKSFRDQWIFSLRVDNVAEYIRMLRSIIAEATQKIQDMNLLEDRSIGEHKFFIDSFNYLCANAPAELDKLIQQDKINASLRRIMEGLENQYKSDNDKKRSCTTLCDEEEPEYKRGNKRCKLEQL
jgi:hypothetical protein